MMTKHIVILDLFSGIGGFSKGLSEAGFNIKTHYFSEIDKHAIAVYKHNFKNAIYAGSVTTVRGTDIERPNIITFGSPCQDFSLAGKRAGMDGERSSLILHAMRLIDECRPDFFIWENVKGAFSSNNGADYWAIIQAFANIGGYRLEWQLLNTSWVLPQNRERIYLIGHLAVPGRSFRPVFPFGEGDELFSQGSRQKGGGGGEICSTITSNLKRGVHAGGETYIKQIGTRLDSGGKQPYQQNRVYDANGISTALDQAAGKWSIANGTQIRRLTEIECERLQGFPDGWTALGDYDGVVKPVPQTQRYKQCGNAVTVDIVRFIGERLIKYTDDASNN